MSDIKRDMSKELSYHQAGVGGEDGCSLQIVGDVSFNAPEDIRKWEQEHIYNAVKIRLGKVGCVSKALALCKAAR